MKISEIFYSLQGEGPFIGRPTIFIRFSGCNLRCEWCDTKFAWTEGQDMTIGKIIGKIEELRDTNGFDIPYLSVTGGEPLLQITELRKLLHHIIYNVRPEFKAIVIETNITQDPEELDVLENIFFMASPKKGVQYDFFNFKKFTKHPIFWKFVVQDLTDMEWVEEQIQLSQLKNEDVWLMPRCLTSQSQIAKLNWLCEYAMTNGYNVSPRLHILAYENQRGK